MNKIIFLPGDRVYHALHGAGIVDGEDSKNPEYIGVVYHSSGIVQYDHIKTLSFSPWPEANHKRPLHVGYYLVQYKNGKDVHLLFFGGRYWHAVPEEGEASLRLPEDNVRLFGKLRFIGKQLDLEPV